MEGGRMMKVLKIPIKTCHHCPLLRVVSKEKAPGWEWACGMEGAEMRVIEKPDPLPTWCPIPGEGK